MSFFSRFRRRQPATSPADGAAVPALDPDAIGRRLGVPAPDQARELVLYGYDFCPYCRRVFRTLDGLHLDVPRRDTMSDPSARRELQEATGRTQVPCLFIDGVPLLESRDIITWLQAYAAGPGAADQASSTDSSDSHSA